MDTQTDEENGGLFAIDIISSEDDDDTQTTSAKTKVPRDFQSEEDFQAVKRNYRPKIEIGELHKTLTLPIHNPNKIDSQKILHAIEELYFFRRYVEALEVTRRALKGEVGDEFRRVLEEYEERCGRKVEGER